MLETYGQRLAPRVRRKRLSTAQRIDSAAAARIRASLSRVGARVGLHGLMVAVGLVAAVTVWNGANERVQLTEAQPAAVAAADSSV